MYWDYYRCPLFSFLVYNIYQGAHDRRRSSLLDWILVSHDNVLHVLYVLPANIVHHNARKSMESDMGDEDLVFWTGRGEWKSGFFVAEVDGKPVGTVAYQTKVHSLRSTRLIENITRNQTELRVVDNIEIS